MKLYSITCTLMVLSFGFSACKKTKEVCDKVTTTATAAEVASLKNYLAVNSISATEDARGFFYRIDKEGDAIKPTICDSVNVNYIGKFTAGGIFDEGFGTTFKLNSLVLGWQEGIPLIGKGGKIVLYLPPSLAYGATGGGTIPANSNLIFEIDLLDIK